MMLERLHVCVLPVILVVLCCIVPVENPPLTPTDPLSGSYVVSCPTPLKITPRDLNCSNNEVYHIVRNPTSGRYIERCFITLPVPPGYATVMDKSGNLNTEACHEGTFQRHSYNSNTQCACKEAKGSCNKTGQLIASNGNTTHDRTCRCDFKRGYKFSIKPSNECFCQSSSEDCTCIKEECKTGYRLSPDYECEKLYSCKDFIASEESTTESVPDSDISVSLESTTVSVPDNNQCIPERMPTCTVQCYVTAIIAICTAICTALGVIIVFCVLGAVIFGKKKMIKIISCICAPMRICCKKCRPGRNGSADTDNEGEQYVPVQVTETSKGKDSDAVQEIGTESSAMLSNIKLMRQMKLPTSNNQ